MSIDFITLAPTVMQVFKAGDANPKKVKRIVYGQASSDANGIATFYFTDNALVNGSPLLSTLDYAVASVYSTNSTINLRPRVQMREKNISGKYVSANITNISGVTVLGINVLGSENPVSGVIVDFMILGSFDL
ncbi:hypothetical protein M5J14_05980 [Lysinibacillus sp. OL1_EC]|uniref:hypothetical protein n=1 Tax=unclassified Lysinibacillus TaxID=2636778 RepID=UPI001040CD2A|nr:MULTISPECIES: hypothetical protein [unclassified Lysinibacillus]MCM0624071.1 hypothetical protein [Lysinibacillus sp. OL1_EC]TBV88770.1 hypothetical protein EW028_04820 [Lysinibacillus sp. OL1]UKJ43530.1 hypothetical protein L6W14_12175 [Lysinibacillus sp. ACHW1.5]WGT37280.1 hypothetical protein QH639_15655 [Lysinibacillus sp. 1 U-2021]